MPETKTDRSRLVERAPKVFAYEEFAELFKRESHDAHHKHIERLRKELGQSGKDSCIRNVRGRGYYFSAKLHPEVMTESIAQNNNEELKAPPSPQQIVSGPTTPQTVRWQHGNDGKPVGMQVESPDGNREFIPWDELKTELDQGLLVYLGRVLGDTPCTTATGAFEGKKNWVIHIQDPKKKHLGYVWLGGNPSKRWTWDGLIRVGDTRRVRGMEDHNHHIVWQVFQRYSDCSYRRIEALDTAKHRIVGKNKSRLGKMK